MLKVGLAAWLFLIEKEEKKLQARNQKVFYKAVKELKNTIVEKTPVGNPSVWKHKAPEDYTPGFLKKNWKMEIVGKNQIRIFNDASYALVVENGWSQQAPEGMMRISLKEFKDILDKLNKEID